MWRPEERCRKDEWGSSPYHIADAELWDISTGMEANQLRPLPAGQRVTIFGRPLPYFLDFDTIPPISCATDISGSIFTL